MIEVIFDRDDRGFRALYMNGHAGYGSEGNDIICASASTLFYTCANALIELCGMKDEEVFIRETEDGDVDAHVILPDLEGEKASKAQIIMETVHIGFINLRDSVGDTYISLVD